MSTLTCVPIMIDNTVQLICHRGPLILTHIGSQVQLFTVAAHTRPFTAGHCVPKPEFKNEDRTCVGDQCNGIGDQISTLIACASGNNVKTYNLQTTHRSSIPGLLTS